MILASLLVRHGIVGILQRKLPAGRSPILGGLIFCPEYRGCATLSPGSLDEIRTCLTSAVSRTNGRVPMEMCLKLSGSVFKVQSDHTARKKAILDQIVVTMAQAGLDHLEEIHWVEFDDALSNLQKFYTLNRQQAYFERTLKPLMGRVLEHMFRCPVEKAVLMLRPVMRLMSLLRMVDHPELANQLVLAVPWLGNIVAKMPLEVVHAVPLMRLATLAGVCQYKYSTTTRRTELVRLILSRLTKVLEKESMATLGPNTWLTTIPSLCVPLQINGLREEPFFRVLEKDLCHIIPVFPVDRTYLNWSVSVLFAYSHLGIPARGLAEAIARLLETSVPWDMAASQNILYVLRLSWSFVCQSVPPPPRLLASLETVMGIWLHDEDNIKAEVLRIPHLLPFLPRPWPYELSILARLARDVLKHVRVDVGLKVKERYPHMLANVLFPHEGMAAAVGVFDGRSGVLLAYPPHLPTPETLDDGAITALLGHRGVVLIDTSRRATLNPRHVPSGYIMRQKWLLERKGWLVCFADGERHSPDQLVAMMRAKARTETLKRYQQLA